MQLNYLFMLKQPHCDLDDPLIWNGVLDIAQGDGEGEVGEDLWEQEGRVGKSSRESASQF